DRPARAAEPFRASGPRPPRPHGDGGRGRPRGPVRRRERVHDRGDGFRLGRRMTLDAIYDLGIDFFGSTNGFLTTVASRAPAEVAIVSRVPSFRSEEHTSEL